MIKSLLALGMMVVLAATATAQPPHPRQSPISIAATTVNGGYIKVVYGAPYQRERDLFGALVPFGQVWRTGANEATEITFTKAVNFGGAAVPAGTYSLFSIPGADGWTLILNKDLGMWGSYTYKEGNDLVRVPAAVSVAAEAVDPFKISLKPTDPVSNTVHLHLQWGTTVVTLPISVN